ncbi:hypothetical protein ACHWQZ_G002932 [Mnemiopsis leidyi]
MPALPLGKLAILAVKQIAKPIAKGLKNGAKNNDTFKNYIIMPVAQGVHWIDVKVKTTLMGASNANVYKLNEKLAVEYGSEFISEFFLYAFGTAIVLFEYNRSSQKDAKKEQKIRENTEKMENEIRKLQNDSLESVFIIEEQGAEIRSLQRQLGSLHTEVESLKERLPDPT